MKIKFLGTNGWYATKSGNTICSVIFAKDRLVVLDAGDGFHKVAEEAEKAGIKKIDVFLSHVHLDHVIGLHALPKFRKGTDVDIFVDYAYLSRLKALLDHPYTASLGQLHARVRVIPLSVGHSPIPYLADVKHLEHADPCLGFRFSIEGKKIAYCTDSGPHRNIEVLADNADILITECGLMPGEKSNPEWPHMSPEDAARSAKAADAKKLALTHFKVDYTDQNKRKKAEAAARRIFKSTFAAHDGLVLSF
jgi:ribonuclease BN (tRNA processing enzyme)